MAPALESTMPMLRCVGAGSRGALSKDKVTFMRVWKLTGESCACDRAGRCAGIEEDVEGLKNVA